MSERRYSTIGRPLDPEYGTNRWIAGLTIVTTAVATVAAALSDGSVFEVVRTATVWGGSVFLAWALARELDPDAERAAFAAVGVALVQLWALPAPSLLLSVGALLSLRVVNRTVGPSARPLESLVVAAVLAWAAVDLGAWTVAAFGALVFLADRRLRPAGPKLHGMLGGLALASAVALAVLRTSSEAVPIGTVRWVILGCGALFLVRIVRMRRVHASCDNGSELPVARVRVGMALALGLVAASLVLGVPTVYDTGLLWGAMGALGVAGLDPGRGPTR